uniref:Uncharacterized protein n=1 Tax=Corethron hystrix TaxID=216773 RepID=A0A7S1BHF1_9STRA|mmetsp:Transcript_28000/g.64098  ORF Transcript_28000/g.64098 Transcript_28000/m.64098 type:complete len:516 (+) Transcript_28000:31-1578(+)
MSELSSEEASSHNAQITVDQYKSLRSAFFTSNDNRQHLQALSGCNVTVPVNTQAFFLGELSPEKSADDGEEIVYLKVQHSKGKILPMKKSLAFEYMDEIISHHENKVIIEDSELVTAPRDRATEKEQKTKEGNMGGWKKGFFSNNNENRKKSLDVKSSAKNMRDSDNDTVAELDAIDKRYEQGLSATCSTKDEDLVLPPEKPSTQAFETDDFEGGESLPFMEIREVYDEQDTGKLLSSEVIDVSGRLNDYTRKVREKNEGITDKKADKQSTIIKETEYIYEDKSSAETKDSQKNILRKPLEYNQISSRLEELEKLESSIEETNRRRSQGEIHTASWKRGFLANNKNGDKCVPNKPNSQLEETRIKKDNEGKPSLVNNLNRPETKKVTFDPDCMKTLSSPDMTTAVASPLHSPPIRSKQAEWSNDANAALERCSINPVGEGLAISKMKNPMVKSMDVVSLPIEKKCSDSAAAFTGMVTEKGRRRSHAGTRKKVSAKSNATDDAPMSRFMLERKGLL